MIHVYYTRIAEKIDPIIFSNLLKQIPFVFQQQVLKYRRWQDMQSSLFGKLLLLQAAKSTGYTSFSLNHLKYTDLKRPYADGLPDFNISHSGAYTICAINTGAGKIGVDIEEVKDMPVEDFEEQFSKKEMEAILKSEDAMQAFFKLWTKKEAFLKAIGTGLHIPLNQVFIDDNRIIWENSTWFLKELNFEKKYPCHICKSGENDEILMQEVQYL